MMRLMRIIREGNNVPCEAVAQSCHVTETYLREIELGHRRPSAKLGRALEHIYRTNLPQLLLPVRSVYGSPVLVDDAGDEETSKSPNAVDVFLYCAKAKGRPPLSLAERLAQELRRQGAGVHDADENAAQVFLKDNPEVV